MRAAGLKRIELALALTLAMAAAPAAQGAPPLEPVTVRVDAVDVAGREIQADGITWALESTVAIHVPGTKNASLRDVMPGMHVLLALVATGGAAPVVRTLTVLPD